MKSIEKAAVLCGFEVREQRYLPRYRAAWHAHEDAEFCFVVAGTISEQVHAGPFLHCTPLDVSFKPAGVRHRVEIANLTTRCVVVTLSPQRIAQSPWLGRALASPALFDARMFGRACDRLRAELHIADECSNLALESLVLELLVTAARGPHCEASDRVPPWLLRVRDRLHDEPGAKYSLRELAIAVDVRPTTLAQAFRRHYRSSIGEYVRRLRIAKAEELLLAGGRSLSDIALRCGFYDQSHFTRTFRRAMGVPPARYQASIRSS